MSGADEGNALLDGEEGVRLRGSVVDELPGGIDQIRPLLVGT